MDESLIKFLEKSLNSSRRNCSTFWFFRKKIWRSTPKNFLRNTLKNAWFFLDPWKSFHRNYGKILLEKFLEFLNFLKYCLRNSQNVYFSIFLREISWRIREEILGRNFGQIYYRTSWRTLKRNLGKSSGQLLKINTVIFGNIYIVKKIPWRSNLYAKLFEEILK